MSGRERGREREKVRNEETELLADGSKTRITDWGQ